LPDYYFDIETVPLGPFRGQDGASFDPSRAKIISIQYQQLHSITGQAIGELQILREWEKGSSEQRIVEQFKKLFIDGGIWQFIPVGNNLAFESRFMKHKLKQYCNVEGLKLGQRPMIDLKHVLVMANRGSFKGYQRFLGKSGLAANMETWYYGNDWSSIEGYIRTEAFDFVGTYSQLKRELPRIMIAQTV
jgi:hypothetical protein